MILEDLAGREGFREIIHDVIGKIKGGKSLADAMGEYPQVFPKVYVNMIRAGEMGGIVPQVLEDITAYLERTTEMRSYLISSLIYPAVVMFMMIASVLVMILFVIPKFSQIFESSKSPIPLPMQILMGISELLHLLVVGRLRPHRPGRSTSSSAGAPRPRGGCMWDRKVLGLPMFGRLVSLVEVARFNRTLGTLLQSAVPLVNALSLVKEVINNQIIAGTIEPIKNGVKKGEGLVAPMKKAGVFPPLSLHLLEVGEETGNLPGMLLQAADVFESGRAGRDQAADQPVRADDDPADGRRGRRHRHQHGVLHLQHQRHSAIGAIGVDMQERSKLERPQRSARGFSLIELMVVLIILGLIIGIVGPERVEPVEARPDRGLQGADPAAGGGHHVLQHRHGPPADHGGGPPGPGGKHRTGRTSGPAPT